MQWIENSYIFSRLKVNWNHLVSLNFGLFSTTDLIVMAYNKYNNAN